MSKYTPLSGDDSIDDLLEHSSPLSSSRGWRSYLHVHMDVIYKAGALVAINALVIGIALIKSGQIYEELQRSMDVEDTRALPRPDAANGLDKLYRQ